jgi:hypothetical protein
MRPVSRRCLAEGYHRYHGCILDNCHCENYYGQRETRCAEQRRLQYEVNQHAENHLRNDHDTDYATRATFGIRSGHRAPG